MIEVALDVCFYYEIIPSKLELDRQFINCVQCPHLWPIPITTA